ncbi:GPCR, PTH11-type [Ophiocordyceps camponoti-floridani]|uniref:GPCR, PTH11-type n=1 Tax=Ophiocordyceps camponoti-floridani TaxID=2030778 RepID=A0A8H4Q4R1_9HYPO|nr:GPCR, PTH11-type [Ophiocordyceps camponoti-floridani]
MEDATVLVPIMAPPPGVTSNFTDPVTNGLILTRLIPVFMAVVVFFAVLRVYTRAFVTRSLGFDDVLAVFSAALIVADLAVNFYLLHNVSSEGIFGVHLYDVPITRVTGSLMQSIMWLLLLYIVASMSIKLTILTLYHRLFPLVRHVTWMIRIGFALIIASYAAFFIGVLVMCVPSIPRADSFHDRRLSPEAIGLLQCISKCSAIGKVLSVFNPVSDIYLMSIPLPLIKDLRTSRGKKAGAFAIFLTGILACAVSIVGAVFRVSQGLDFGWEIIRTTMVL